MVEVDEQMSTLSLEEQEPTPERLMMLQAKYDANPNWETHLFKLVEEKLAKQEHKLVLSTEFFGLPKRKYTKRVISVPRRQQVLPGTPQTNIELATAQYHLDHLRALEEHKAECKQAEEDYIVEMRAIDHDHYFLVAMERRLEYMGFVVTLLKNEPTLRLFTAIQIAF